MIPFVEQPSVRVGPLTIHAFGALVAAALMIGLVIGDRRFTKLGLNRALGERLAWWAVIGGLLGAHVFSVLFYFPREVAHNPLILFRFWEDISSFGSMLGGILGVWLFLRRHARRLDTLARCAYLDVAAFVFPISLAIGRIACSLAHDHPGTITSFPLSISLASAEAQRYIVGVYRDAGRLSELPPPAVLAHLGFNDLGWYELLYLTFILVPIVLVLDRKRRTPGIFLLTFILLYMPVRFGLDFLRIADARYLGLTPGQWIALVALGSVPWLLRIIRRNREAANARDLLLAAGKDQKTVVDSGTSWIGRETRT